MAVLASGSGTLLEAMFEAALPIQLVVTDRPCRALDIAAERGAPAVLVERASFGADFDRDAYTKQLVGVLEEHGIELVAMAGFGTVLGEHAFDAFAGRVLNTHPALLPSFKGWHAVRDALAYGVKVTGCTVHVATPAVDHGPILAQEAVSVLPDDTEAALHERIKQVERRLYIQTISDILQRGSVQ
jgi:phosphoribosylglycinamide formyltransferase 1